MAFTQHGSADYVFGFDDPEAEAIADSIGLKPQTLSISGEPEFTAEAKNLEGMTEAVVVGDRKNTFTMSGFVVDNDLLENAVSFEYDGKYFVVMNVKRDISNTDFQKAEITGTSNPLVIGLAS